MKLNAKTFFGLLKQSYKEWSEDKASRLAAALAYYTVFAIAPMLVIILAVAGIFYGDEAARGEIYHELEGTVGAQGAEMVQTILENSRKTSSSVVATIIGIVTLIMGATGFFGQLQDALNTVWDVEAKPKGGIIATIKDRFVSFTMILGIGFLLLVSLVLTAVIAGATKYIEGMLPGLEILSHILNIVISFGVITVLFAMIYRVLPDIEIAWKDVWIGAAFTALLFTIGKFIIGLYLGQSSTASTYGAAGSLIVLLLWVYYSAQILLFGAEFTQVYATQYGSLADPAKRAEKVAAGGGMPAETKERREAKAAQIERETASIATMNTKTTPKGFFTLIGMFILVTLLGYQKAND